MKTREEIDRLAEEIIRGTDLTGIDDPEEAGRRVIAAVTGLGLAKEDARAVLKTYCEMEIERAQALRAKAERDRQEGEATLYLVRLARAAGCPDGVPMIPFLIERGLVEEDGRGGCRLTERGSGLLVHDGGKNEER